MTRYQLRAPAPLKTVPSKFRRQELDGDAASTPKAEGGPPSPESLASSPSTVGASSDDGASDSDDETEPPSPTTSSSLAVAVSGAPNASSNSITSSATSLVQSATKTPSPPTRVQIAPWSSRSSSSFSTVTSANLQSSSPPAFTQSLTSQGNNAALPQITYSASSSSPSPVTSLEPSSFTNTRSPIESVPVSSSSQTVTSSSLGSPAGPAQSDTAESDQPRRSSPQDEPPIMTRSAAIAATMLSILGALALLIGAILFIKHRKRKRTQSNHPPAPNAFNPDTVHTGPPLSRLSTTTHSTDHSNPLFAALSSSRPETVTTTRSEPLSNPFADPPRNKAYDVLAGRPRSTTLTDRGSWIRNPFRDPESERFDPFGELKEKARRERVRYVEEAKRERERERNVSGVTVEGMGVLDRGGRDV